MKQFFTVFKFELSGYLKNKIFTGLTVAVIIILGIVLFYPRFNPTIHEKSDILTAKYASEIVFSEATVTDAKRIASYLSEQLIDAEITVSDKSRAELTAEIENDTYDMAVILTSPVSYDYIVKTAGITDSTAYYIDNALIDLYRLDRLEASGISGKDANEIVSCEVKSNAYIIGKDQTQSFFYTYILMFLLYFAVMVYGQFVAQGVALEKSSRAMELLITSAKPENLMFGKILGAGAAGLIQIILILGSAFSFYSVNKEFWKDNIIIKSVFGIPLSMLVYTAVFFVLGFLLYSFMYGAAASLANKLEDINTLAMPITFAMVISFLITIFSMVSNVDSVLMKAASFIPLTSPMSMFTRIAMGNVKSIEIIISIIILLLSTVATGYIASAIYKVGVLMYGKPPKLNELIRAINNSKK